MNLLFGMKHAKRFFRSELLVLLGDQGADIDEVDVALLLGNLPRSLTVVVDADFDVAVLPSDGATFSLPVTLPPNAVRMRFVVRDASNGRMGTFDIAKP